MKKEKQDIKTVDSIIFNLFEPSHGRRKKNLRVVVLGRMCGVVVVKYSQCRRCAVVVLGRFILCSSCGSQNWENICGACYVCNHEGLRTAQLQRRRKILTYHYTHYTRYIHAIYVSQVISL